MSGTSNIGALSAHRRCCNVTTVDSIVMYDCKALYVQRRGRVCSTTSNYRLLWVALFLLVSAPAFGQAPGGTSAIPQELQKSVIDFQVNNQVRYILISQFRDESSKQDFARGWLTDKELQSKLDSLDVLRSQYDALEGNEKEKTAVMILRMEKEIFIIDNKAKDAYVEANRKETAYWSKAGAEELTRFRRESAFLEDSIRTVREEALRAEASAMAPLIVEVAGDNNVAPSAPKDIIVYKVQIGAYRNTPPEWVQRQHNKLAVLRRIDRHTDENGITVYTIGALSSLDDATRLQNQIRTEGITNAFVVAYLNNNRITLEDAKKIANQ